MASTTTIQSSRRELAHRVSNGIEVTLFWGPRSGEVVVEVFDQGSEHCFEVAVPSECALDAFQHPFAYAARQGVRYETQLLHAA